jgi:menaquinol-cytochrome c reductase iron-sulfur subunit
MSEEHESEPAPLPERRDFLKKSAAIVLGAAGLAVPIGAGVATFLDPLRRQSEGGGFLFVTSLNALRPDGVPRRFPVIADKADIWNKFPHVPIGAVYLRRTPDDKIEALNVICPHAGCPVEFRPSTNLFLCPCHDSSFQLNGAVANAGSPSPRGLDTLAVEVRHGREVWVKFQNFRAATPEKIPV